MDGLPKKKTSFQSRPSPELDDTECTALLIADGAARRTTSEKVLHANEMGTTKIARCRGLQRKDTPPPKTPVRLNLKTPLPQIHPFSAAERIRTAQPAPRRRHTCLVSSVSFVAAARDKSTVENRYNIRLGAHFTHSLQQ